MKRRITVLTRETYERVSVVAALGPTRAWCAGCIAEADLISPEQASALSGLSTRAIYRLVEAGSIHFDETLADALLVCSTSLSQYHLLDAQRSSTYTIGEKS